MERENPELIRKLTQSNIGRLAEKSTVHFCGLAWVDHDAAFVFVPRQSLGALAHENLETARLTMRALARFGREMTGRLGVASAAEGQTGLLAIIAELAQDFIQHGIYAERTRHDARNSGKPLWARTVMREQAFVGSDGSVVYASIRTTRTKDSHNSLLARVQTAVMLEIALQHGWWLEGVHGREGELQGYDPPSLPRFMWATHLRLLLPELYAARAIYLANVLIAYLENDRGRQSGETYFGLEDFHAVWEHMLRRTLAGVELGWNSRLPRPVYVRPDGSADTQERGLQTDIVLRDASGIRVVDAKYYDATSTFSSPGVSDIIKQLFYDYAISSLTKEETVTGCFVFPGREDGDGQYAGVEMRHRDGSPETSFPKIECHYLSMLGVLRAYVVGKKIVLPAVLPT